MITGATSGLGKEAAKVLASKGAATVVMAVRNMQKGEAVLPTLRAATDRNANLGDYFGPSGFIERAGSPVVIKCYVT